MLAVNHQNGKLAILHIGIDSSDPVAYSPNGDLLRHRG